MSENEITLFVIGKGGSGKTYLLKKVSQFLRNEGYEVSELTEGLLAMYQVHGESIKIRRLQGSARK